MGFVGRTVRNAAALIALLAVTLGTAGIVAAQEAGGQKETADRGEPAFIKLSGGFKGDIFADRDSGGYFAFEYRADADLELWRIRPSFGVAATTDTSIYAWTGLNLDIFFGRRIVLTPTTGVGLYRQGDGQDLGSIVEFRNGAELAWRFDDRSRFGAGLHYISNYGLGDEDPGIGVFTIFYAHPLEAILPP